MLPAGPAAPPPEPPKGASWSLRLLIILYALSVIAALAVIFRESPPPAAKVPGRLKLLAASKQDAVGWLTIHGPIFESETGRLWERGVEEWARRLRALADRAEVKAIVLDINSPGGSVGAVQELHSAIRRVREEKKKPVVALLGDVAASGGYYLAVGCDKVVAHPGSLLGSIGVIFNTMNVEGLLAKIGVKSQPIKSGRFKDIGSPVRPMTPEERQMLQDLIDDAYGQFFAAVLAGRRIPEEELRTLADGRIFTGRQAKPLGLVDELGDSRDAIALAGKLGGIAGVPRVLREGDSLEQMLGLLNARLADWLRPQAALLNEIRSVVPMGLEYRWSPL